GELSLRQRLPLAQLAHAVAGDRGLHGCPTSCQVSFTRSSVWDRPGDVKPALHTCPGVACSFRLKYREKRSRPPSPVGGRLPRCSLPVAVVLPVPANVRIICPSWTAW